MAPSTAAAASVRAPSRWRASRQLKNTVPARKQHVGGGEPQANLSVDAQAGCHEERIERGAGGRGDVIRTETAVFDEVFGDGPVGVGIAVKRVRRGGDDAGADRERQ